MLGHRRAALRAAVILNFGKFPPLLTRLCLLSLTNFVRVHLMFDMLQWWMGNYYESWANDDISVNPYYPSVTSAGRVVRINTPNYVKLANGTWVVGPPTPGEGLYACHNKGSCVAPDTCVCPDGWTGPDCATPLCRHIGANNDITLGCLNGGVCASKDSCVCPSAPSLLWQVNPAMPEGALTGYAGQQCTKPMCTQGVFVETCKNDKDATDDPGCWRCPNGGNCTAPDTCSCPPQWSGFDCRSPVCTLHANEKIKYELNTLDSEKVTSFEQDPCGAGKIIKLANGSLAPRGRCVKPNTCECTCKRRAGRDGSGRQAEWPWHDPLLRPIPPGYIFGEGDCLDGYQGSLNPDGTYSSCHLQIYVPTWLERNSLYLLCFGAAAVFAAILLYLIIRRQLRARYRRLKAERRKRRQAMMIPAAPAASEDEDGKGSGDEDDVDGTGGTGSGGGRRGHGNAAARQRRHSVSSGAFTGKFKRSAGHNNQVHPS